MGWSAVAKGVEQGAKLLFDICVVVAEDLEDFIHDIRVMVADGAGAYLVTIHHHVILVGSDS